MAVFDLVNRQDWDICELTQLGLTSKTYRAGGVSVPIETHIRAFGDFILEALREDDRGVVGLPHSSENTAGRRVSYRLPSVQRKGSANEHDS